MTWNENCVDRGDTLYHRGRKSCSRYLWLRIEKPLWSWSVWCREGLLAGFRPLVSRSIAASSSSLSPPTDIRYSLGWIKSSLVPRRSKFRRSLPRSSLCVIDRCCCAQKRVRLQVTRVKLTYITFILQKKILRLMIRVCVFSFIHFVK